MTDNEYRAFLLQQLADMARHLLQQRADKPPQPITLADFHRAPRTLQ